MRNLAVLRAVLSAAVPLLLAQHPATAATDGGISLAVTLGTDPTEGACGTDTTLQATQGDQVNFCYVVTNNSSTTLNFHSLSDDVTGDLLIDSPVTLDPGRSYQYNRIVTAMTSEAPVSTWSAYDVHPDYIYTDNASVNPDDIFNDGFEGTAAQYSFIDITTTGTSLMLSDDDYTVASIGFPFTFYGHTADQLTVSNNGGMLFDQGTGIAGRQGYLSGANRVLPDRLLGPAILPYWDDLQQDYIDGIGNVFVQTIGDAPNREFVVEWYNLPVNDINGGQPVTFEAILFEGSNNILFQYMDTDCGYSSCNDGAAATIGLNSDGEHAIPYSFNEASVGTGRAILFHPTTPLTYTATDQVTLDVGAPIVGVDPASFAETVSAGASVDDTMTISNTGNRTLTWNVGEVGSTRAHFPPVPRFALPMGDPADTRVGPRPFTDVGKPLTSSRAPLGIGVPAYAAEVLNSSLVSMDASAPSTVNYVSSLDGLNFLAGDFAGEDFSTLYAIDFRSYDLYKIDTATGALTLVYLTVPPPGVSSNAWNGMSWDPTTNTMFAVTSGGRTAASYLVKLDLATAETTPVGTITGVGDPTNGTVIIDIAVDPNGLMYGVDIVTDTLVAIDKTTGEASTIGSIGFDANYSEGLDFDDSTGVLYFSAIDNSTGLAEMYTLDTQTGMGTLISPISPDPSTNQFAALGIAKLRGICAYPGTVPWLSFSSTRGSTLPGDTTPITVTFDATSLSAGSYSANICVNNNDLTNNRLAVPVTLTVQ